MKRWMYIPMLAIGVLMVLPLLWMFSSSFKNTGEIFSYPPRLIPPVIRMDNYEKLWAGTSTSNFPQWFVNSVFVSACTIIPSLFFCSLAGFGFAKYEFRGRKLLFTILLASMMLPFYTVLVPVYTLMIHLGWTDTYYALIVPFVASAFGVFLMKQYMAGIPNELLDAARIDGASEFEIYWRIILPLSKPALAALTIMGFRGSWNSYLWPMLVLSDPQKFTVPMGVVSLASSPNEGEQLWGAIMASSALAVLPVLFLFILMQKQFISGMTVGSIKR